MIPEPVKISGTFKLTCYKFQGIDAIRAALMEGEKHTTAEVPIKFRSISSPTYEGSTTTINKKEGLELMIKAMKTVENSIKLREGNFIMLTQPMVQGDDKNNNAIQEQLDQIKEMENKEGEGKYIFFL